MSIVFNKEKRCLSLKKFLNEFCVCVTKPNMARNPDSPILGVSMSKQLKDRIKALADKERRTMANWCVIQLENAVEALESAQSGRNQDAPGYQPLNSVEALAQKKPAPAKRAQ